MTCAPMCTAYHFSSNLYSLKVHSKNLCGQNESYLKYSELLKKKKKHCFRTALLKLELASDLPGRLVKI